MIKALGNVFKVKELRNKVLFMLAMMAVYRLGAHIPVPGVDVALLQERLFGGNFGGALDFLDLFAGGALKNFTIFAMSITPYITASIILQLLTVVVPKLEELSKQGNEGRKKIAQYTRYGTIVLAVIQAVGITMYIRRFGAVPNATAFDIALIIVSLTAGTAFLMWLGEQITDKGIGNGISIIIFTSIISRFPSDMYNTYELLQAGTISILNVLIFAVLAIIIIAGIIFVQQGERRIPVQYSKRIVGRRVYGGRSTHIPMKINQAGVIPVIFASSVLLFPGIIAQVLPYDWATGLANAISPGSGLYMVLYGLMILFFTYFYTAITFNPEEVADNMKKYGGFIPGIRPGRPTINYLDRVLMRVTLAGAIFLTIVALLPFAMQPLTGVTISFGGTSLIIMVGVALKTMEQIESHLLMRHYEGFMK
ncbi:MULTISPECIES: preprotein translocase subunit SecY [Halanaerobium]|uniref:Protein translocase subunit SecY n=1 Tax=Halanaerobium kushneri TaxID=56779 RepID=A0A1N6W0L8_9FIRM|nr:MULTISPECIES: preprotein translocase subunit SecY [Halanaerobium]RCW53957.1 protein translocase subunit secY/sec61 alpha [Halanaerobium sp. ST460_2HS_T2]SIQ83555.1 protein translocase subunit secY/sec61 alpha [Halanaerobium kushneri]